MPRPRSDIRPRLLEVALDAFSHKGVDGASLRAIARDAETNIGMIYYYFPTKDDLFLAVVEDAYEGILERLETALAPGQGFEERLEALFAIPGTLTEHETAVLRLMVREALTSHERMDRLFERFRKGHLPLLIDLVGQGFRTGAIDRKHNPFLAMALVGGIGMAPRVFFHLVSARLPELGDNPELPKRIPRQLARMYLRALGSDEPSDPDGFQQP